MRHTLASNYLTNTAQTWFVLSFPRPDVVLITLNRPDRMNSMALDRMKSLRQILKKWGI